MASLLFLLAATPSLLVPPPLTTSSKPAPPLLLDRRAALSSLGGALAAAITLPVASAHAAGAALTPSAMLTAGQWLNDLKSASKGLESIPPLLERGDDPAYEAIRIAIRKAPVNGIRKACSKIILLVKDGGDKKLLAEKEELYASIKVGLEALDIGSRPAEEGRTRPDLQKILSKLQDDVAAFGKDLGVVAESDL